MMRLLRVLMFLFRMIFGFTYIFSGFFKLVDPVGTGLIVREYMNIMHLGFLSPLSIAGGMLLSITELILGIALLMCVRMKCAGWIALIMQTFFTILTLFVAIFDAVDDCGCFGRAVHLDAWETFYKNILLIICAIPVFLFRNKFKRVAPAVAEWIFLGVYAAIALLFALYSLIAIPIVEFGDYKVGANLALKVDELSDNSRFETRFIYEKEGHRAYFPIDSLPDRTWEYIDSETTYSGDPADLLFDMTITERTGEIVTHKIVNSQNPVLLFVPYRPHRLGELYWEDLSSSLDSALALGAESYVVVPDMDDPVIAEVSGQYPNIGKAVVEADYKTLLSMVRSNGGMVYLYDGIVIKKWPGWWFEPEDIKSILTTDPEEISARSNIYHHLVYEVALLLIFLVIIIFRYVCGIIYGKKKRVLPDSATTGAEVDEGKEAYTEDGAEKQADNVKNEGDE